MKSLSCHSSRFCGNTLLYMNEACVKWLVQYKCGTVAFIFMSENCTKITVWFFFFFSQLMKFLSLIKLCPFKYLDNLILSAGLSFNTTMQGQFLLLFSSCWEMEATGSNFNMSFHTWAWQNHHKLFSKHDFWNLLESLNTVDLSDKSNKKGCFQQNGDWSELLWPGAFYSV